MCYSSQATVGPTAKTQSHRAVFQSLNKVWYQVFESDMQVKKFFWSINDKKYNTITQRPKSNQKKMPNAEFLSDVSIHRCFWVWSWHIVLKPVSDPDVTNISAKAVMIRQHCPWAIRLQAALLVDKWHSWKSGLQQLFSLTSFSVLLYCSFLSVFNFILTNTLYRLSVLIYVHLRLQGIGHSYVHVKITFLVHFFRVFILYSVECVCVDGSGIFGLDHIL